MSESTFVVPGAEIDLNVLDIAQGGDNTATLETEPEKSIILGPGLIESENGVISFVAGHLKHNSNDTVWVESNRKRATEETEPVIGTVIARNMDGYRVDIDTVKLANLNGLAFENATKRNKPDLRIGSLVYAKVVLANKYLEPEIECYNNNTNKSEGFGELTKGFLIKTSLVHCRRLLQNNSVILNILGQHIAYEIAVGLNGYVWIKSDSPEKTIIVANAIRNSEHLSDENCALMVKQMVSTL
ncbi:hypothetical protein BB561_003933 [Smittium simulii]|uniref:Ribosomal RNA-processing protein 40 n=1 Tax=Smittium simulii TaxID=133385 RepID=A0A2T9YIV6_9FUNG|nr:hypothetical protein BB561_003933 [Smittium simulii]